MVEGVGAASDELGIGAGQLAEAKRLQVEAVNGHATTASIASATDREGQRRDAIADAITANTGADLMNLATELVAHDGIRLHPDAVLDGVQIGAADTAGVNLDDNLAGGRPRLRGVNHGHFEGSLVNCNFHRSPIGGTDGNPDWSPPQIREVL